MKVGHCQPFQRTRLVSCYMRSGQLKSMKEETQHLEPRVARLETTMEALSRNVDNLTDNVNQLTKIIDDKFSTLQVGLANANAPKKTDWSLFISIGFFILALGAAVFWPLNKTSQDNKD